MSRVFVCGLGAVSPAGWGVAALGAVLKQGAALPVESLERPGWEKAMRVRLVPNPTPRPAFLAHPRLRRSSSITQNAAGAAIEASAWRRADHDEDRRLGLILCLQSGCVQYTSRFFAEVLQDPATASPLLFPETVFAAPAGHVAALLGKTLLVQTITGDPAAFLEGLSLGAQWLEADRVAACLVVGAEETHWLLADALAQFEPRAVLSGGAGAVCLSRDPAVSLGVELAAITDAHTYRTLADRARAAQAMRAQLPAGSADQLLCDGLADSPRADAPELAAWRDWTGPRLSPKRVLGEGLMAAGAWQCVAACLAVAEGRFAAANVSLVGSNQQAAGARFVRAEPSPASGHRRRPDVDGGIL